MDLVPGDLNRKLARAVRLIVAAESANISGRTAFWRLTALGILAFGVLVAVGLGFWGYAFVYRSQYTLAGLSGAFAEALSKVQLQAAATGIVNIEPRNISLAPGQTVSLSPGSTVSIEKGSFVRADGDIIVQGPSVSTLPTSGQRSASGMPNIVNFTVFKALPFQRGTVQTGWMFLTSAQPEPTAQYCYYTEKMDSPGVNVMFDIAADGKLEVPKKIPPDFDIEAAFQKCLWFKAGGP